MSIDAIAIIVTTLFQRKISFSVNNGNNMLSPFVFITKASSPRSDGPTEAYYSIQIMWRPETLEQFEKEWVSELVSQWLSEWGKESKYCHASKIERAEVWAM